MNIFIHETINNFNFRKFPPFSAYYNPNYINLSELKFFCLFKNSSWYNFEKIESYKSYQQYMQTAPYPPRPLQRENTYMVPPPSNQFQAPMAPPSNFNPYLSIYK